MHALSYKRLNTSYLFNEKGLIVRKEIYASADNVIMDPVYIFEYPDIVCAVALTEREEVIMVEQFRPGTGKVVIELPGGKIDIKDESPATAIERELLEETGFVFRSIYPLGVVAVNPVTHNNRLHMFLATGGHPEKEQQFDKDERIEIRLLPLAKAMALLQKSEFLNNAYLVTTFFYALLKMKKLDFT
ncbi:NUDIX hydrolase [Chitinophaga solisilvae]|uniref:NUDIX hydrolase n=1 Tax=Chitinophaga solisilvae TaxID=1233460 RepID=UPI001367A2FA|nr:NUDIX hydrolase [Chitinophaga solisilvae]